MVCAYYEGSVICLFQLQMFYDEQAKYMQMFDMINKLMSCHMQSFMSVAREPVRSGKTFEFAAVFVQHDIVINMIL